MRRRGSMVKPEREARNSDSVSLVNFSGKREARVNGETRKGGA